MPLLGWAHYITSLLKLWLSHLKNSGSRVIAKIKWDNIHNALKMLYSQVYLAVSMFLFSPSLVSGYFSLSFFRHCGLLEPYNFLICSMLHKVWPLPGTNLSYQNMLTDHWLIYSTRESWHTMMIRQNMKAKLHWRLFEFLFWILVHLES